MSVAKIPSQGETTPPPPPKVLMTVLGTIPLKLTLGHQWIYWADVKNIGEGLLSECGCFSLIKKENPHWKLPSRAKDFPEPHRWRHLPLVFLD